jgi:hypothetical protein
MNLRNELSHQLVRGTSAERETDLLLRELFQTTMPTPWPTWKFPPAEPAATPRTARSLFWGRFALAASVALLLGSQLWLASFYRPPEPTEATGRSKQPVDVATKPQVSNPDADSGIDAGSRTPGRPVLKNMR